VWQGFDGHEHEIYLYDGTSVTQVTDNDYYDGFPKVSGSNIAWRAVPGAIFYLDPNQPTEVFAAVALPDDDGDGVSNQEDQCPDTPLGTHVNAEGCPPCSFAASPALMAGVGASLFLLGSRRRTSRMRTHRRGVGGSS